MIQQVQPFLKILLFPARVPVSAQAALLPVQLYVSMPGKTVEDDPSAAWAHLTHVEATMEFLAPGFGQGEVKLL